MKLNEIEITVVRCRNTRMVLHVDEKGEVSVRVPLYEKEENIRAFVSSKKDWIAKQVSKMKARNQAVSQLAVMSSDEIEKCIEKARAVYASRTAYFAQRMGVTYGRITIRDQKTRWGSCSSKGNLNFNWRLILAPERVLDYVVVHELAHRKQMNHSRLFWKEVEKIMPDYREQSEWLGKNGWMLKYAGKGSTDGE